LKNNIDYLLSPKAIRESTQALMDYTKAGRGYFKIHMEKLNPCVDYVLTVIKENYPTLDIPFHSRWGHFRAAGLNREILLNEKLQSADAIEKARCKLDLVITSVLLDAGSGPTWKYNETSTGKTITRSEGLGVASFHMFMNGAFSSDSNKPLQANAQGLKNVTESAVEKYFQVTEANPLVGVAGRVSLLKNLGSAVENAVIFPMKRPGSMIDYLMKKYGKEIPAEGLLRAVLDGLGSIWPGRIALDGVNLGDVWKHQGTNELTAFHKLSQWMTYSLVEPLIEARLKVTGAEKLTGLAEYRNGGLILDFGLITAKNLKDLQNAWKPEEDFIIEWRALTICMLDLIGAEVQKTLGKSPQEFPLAKVLEGGTWWAGRKIAAEKRPGGGPPFQIISDGTVF
jgi:Protein of unknown function (DUF1688)